MFKVGDRVVAVDFPGRNGQRATVTDVWRGVVDERGVVDYVSVKWDDGSSDHGWPISRFRLLKDEGLKVGDCVRAGVDALRYGLTPDGVYCVSEVAPLVRTVRLKGHGDWFHAEIFTKVLEEKETKMKIAGHEVKVLGRDRVKIGCAEFTRRELDKVDEVRKMMDAVPKAVRPWEMEKFVPHVAIYGGYKGAIFMRGSNEIVFWGAPKTFLEYGWSSANNDFAWDNTLVLPIPADDFKEFLGRMVEKVGGGA